MNDRNQEGESAAPDPSDGPGSGAGERADPPDGESGSTAGSAPDSRAVSPPTDEKPEGGAPAGAQDQERSVAEKAGIDEAVLGTPRNLDPKVRYRWVLGSSIGAVVIGAVAGAAAFLSGRAVPGLTRSPGSATGVAAAVFAALFLVGVARAVLLYRSWEYVVREDSLFLSRGVLTRVRTVAPYVRVQHVDTRRSPVERLLGLSTLVVYTAGSRGADVTIPGLTPGRATDLQKRLKRLAIESEEEDAV